MSTLTLHSQQDATKKALRIELAKAALTGLLAHPDTEALDPMTFPDEYADMAVNLADAVMRRLEK